MNQVGLILWKDSRRLRWALLLFLLLVAGAAWTDLHDPWPLEFDRSLEGLSGAFAILLVLTSIVIVGLLVHQDPLLGTSAYWMTRPVQPLALLAAKLAFMFLFLALVPAIVDLGVLIRFGLEPSQWLKVLLTGFVAYGFALLVAAALAAVTPGIAVFLVASIAVAFVMLLIYVFAGLWNVQGPAAVWGESLANLCVLGVSCITIWMQYHRYDVRLSRGLLALGLLLGPLVFNLPWHRLEPSTEGEQLNVAVSPTDLVGVYRIYGSAARPSLTARWGLFNAPADQFYELRSVWGKVRRDDGQDLLATCFLKEGVSSVYYGLALKATLPDYTWYEPPEASQPEISLSLHTQDPVAGRTVSFHGQAQLRAYRFERAGSLPLTAGARLHHDSLVMEVTHARKGRTDVVVDLRSSQIVSDPFSGGGLEILLVRKNRREVARPRSPGERDAHEMGTFSTRTISRPGGVVQLRRFTSLYPLPFEPQIDRLDDLEIQVWRAVRKGPYFGRIELPQFRTNRSRQ